MICPKCKTKVSKSDTTCPTCNLRLVLTCPRCDSPTRLGSVSCKKCGYKFVKFCPDCNSANHPTAMTCRKCGVVFLSEDILKPKKQAKKVKTINLENKKEIKVQNLEAQENQKDSNTLLMYVDFVNLDRTFEKYNKEEFKQKVILNIKTTVKIAFGAICDFINSHCVVFRLNYTANTKSCQYTSCSL